MACRDYLSPENVDAADRERFARESAECGWCKEGWPLIPNGVAVYGHAMHSVPEPMSQVPLNRGLETRDDSIRLLR